MGDAAGDVERLESLSMEYQLLDVASLAEKIRSGVDQFLLIDSRSFLEFNTSNIHKSVNVCCSKLVKRRLQQGKICIKDLLSQSCQFLPDEDFEIVVYDQCSVNPEVLTSDNFVIVLLNKLQESFKNVMFLEGGFLEFQASHPKLCQSQNLDNPTSMTLTSVSQPCLSATNSEGPTKILSFLFLGSQQDALSKETAEVNGIGYVLNVSISSPKPSHVQDSHFLRIPVNDNYCAKLLPYFHQAFQFIEKVREANGCVIIHCVAGISRSPTLAIAYLMTHLNMSMDEAYRYVKEKRPTISPNFNFLGQLLEYEKELNGSKEVSGSSKSAAVLQSILDNPLTSPRLLGESVGASDAVRPFCFDSVKDSSRTHVKGVRSLPKFSLNLPATTVQTAAQSPTTALAKLNFNVTSESPSSDKDPFTGRFPMTTLDKLNFTPCVAHDDTSLPRTQDEVPSKGTKRPLSLGCSETRLKNAEADFNQNTSQGSAEVIMRSPEVRAKRPLVRPNSIAFSSYPVLEMESSDSQDCVSTKTTLNSGCLPHSSSYTCMKLEKSQGNALPLENTLGRGVHLGNVEKNRKSRSLENILQSPGDESFSMTTCSSCTGHCHMGRGGGGTSDFYSGLSEVVKCRCRGLSDPHLSSSSISSGGSHNSLHGSLEIIQVS